MTRDELYKIAQILRTTTFHTLLSEYELMHRQCGGYIYDTKAQDILQEHMLLQCARIAELCPDVTKDEFMSWLFATELTNDKPSANDDTPKAG